MQPMEMIWEDVCLQVIDKEAWNKCTAWCVTIINGRTTVYRKIINIEKT